MISCPICHIWSDSLLYDNMRITSYNCNCGRFTLFVYHNSVASFKWIFKAKNASYKFFEGKIHELWPGNAYKINLIGEVSEETIREAVNETMIDSVLST